MSVLETKRCNNSTGMSETERFERINEAIICADYNNCEEYKIVHAIMILFVIIVVGVTGLGLYGIIKEVTEPDTASNYGGFVYIRKASDHDNHPTR